RRSSDLAISGQIEDPAVDLLQLLWLQGDISWTTLGGLLGLGVVRGKSSHFLGKNNRNPGHDAQGEGNTQRQEGQDSRQGDPGKELGSGALGVPVCRVRHFAGSSSSFSSNALYRATLPPQNIAKAGPFSISATRISTDGISHFFQ
ncbi:MAG: hypothetical protein AAEJ65_06105, partial [Planctomycetota bacterium]